MKVWIDRNTCDAHLATCLSCFGRLALTGVPDRGCIRDYEEDGSKDLTIFMKSDGHEETLVIPEEMRELVAYEGWDQFVSFEPAFRRGEGVERVVN